jgi:GTP-binding protein Era
MQQGPGGGRGGPFACFRVEINMSDENESGSEAGAGAPGTGRRSGYVALVGRPNAGKSTLLNKLVGEKIAAVSNKPQTTRGQIRGVITRPEGQIVLVDTPGVHQPGHLLNRRMMAAVHDALEGVDLLLLIRDASAPTGNGDRFVLELVRQTGKPAVLLLNKTDRLSDKSALLPLMDWYGREHEWRSVVPISARKGDVVETLVPEIIRHLPEGDPVFDEDELTDQPLRALVAEIVREKILQTTGEEIPYVTAVVTERYEEVSDQLSRIYCAIYVERASQKKIVIGKGAERLKEIGTRARHDIERLVGHRVYLELFVKVEEDWRNSPRALNEMGIQEGGKRRKG